MRFPHYKVEEFKTAKLLDKRINQLFSNPPDDKHYYLYMLSEGPRGYTAVFAESRVPKGE